MDHVAYGNMIRDRHMLEVSVAACVCRSAHVYRNIKPSLQQAVRVTHSMGPGQPARWDDPTSATQEGALAWVSTAKVTL
jgi:hypothetical protein